MKRLLYGELDPRASCVAVIMAGGSGTRFWPMSRTGFPKQFLPLGGGEKSLLQLTVERLLPLTSRKGIVVVTAEHQREIVEQQLPGICVLAEPRARNTAPCVGFAAKMVLESVGDVPMICLPADHLIKQGQEMREVFKRGVELARARDSLITIGIKPLGPETGYGYIRRGQVINESSRVDAFSVRAFVEKPDRETAESYVKSGEYYWNSGMFIWRPSVLLAALKRFLPEMSEGLDRLGTLMFDADGYGESQAVYEGFSPTSIDIGVMERADNVLMLAGESFDWSDVGSWTTWAESMAETMADASGNVTKGEVVLLDSRSCAVVGGSRLIAAVGLENLVIVDTGDALLVCHRDCSQNVKKIVDILREQKKVDLV